MTISPQPPGDAFGGFPDPSASRNQHGRRALILGLGVLGAGVAAAIAVSSAGAQSTNGTGSTGDQPPGYAAPGFAADGSGGAGGYGGGRGGQGGPGAVLDSSGTVTAVGSSSVTIQTSAGTKTYAVGADSDIDKNGEAQLSDLAVGDAVRFSTTSVNGTATIRILHAGDEAKDRPSGPPPGDGDGGGSQQPDSGSGSVPSAGPTA